MSEKLLELTDATFDREVLQSAVPVLVDFWAVWCGPCKMVTRTVEEMAAEYPASVKFAAMDVDGNPDTAVKYGIRGLPNVLIFKNGEVADHLVGAVSRQQLTGALEPHL